MAEKPKRKPRAKGKYYIDRKELLAEVVKSKELGKMSDRLAMMLDLLTTKYAKSPQYIGYSYNDDMQGYAKLNLVNVWDRFNPDKSDNPFAFYTQCIKHSFMQYLNKEKKQRNIRDELLIKNGLTPSYSYQSAYQEEQDERRRYAHDEEDHERLLEDAKDLNVDNENDFKDTFIS